MNNFIPHYFQASNSAEARGATVTGQPLTSTMDSAPLNLANAPHTTITSSLSPPAPTTKRQPVVTYPQRPSRWARIADRLRLEYYRYQVTIGIYSIQGFELYITNGFFLVVFGLLIWTILFYFPSLLYHKLARLDWLLTGRDVTLKPVTLPVSNSLIRSPQYCFAEHLDWINDLNLSSCASQLRECVVNSFHENL